VTVSVVVVYFFFENPKFSIFPKISICERIASFRKRRCTRRKGKET